MPSSSEKQRQFMGAELQRKREGEPTKTDMSEKQLEEFAEKPLSKQIDNFIEKRLHTPQDVFRSKEITPHQEKIFQGLNAIREKYKQKWHPKASPNRIMSPGERREKYAFARSTGANPDQARSIRDKHYATVASNLGYLRKSLNDFIQKWGQGVYPPNKPHPWFKKKTKVKYNKPEHENVHIKPEK